METRKKTNKHVEADIDKDFLKQQIDQAIKTFLAQFTILIQVLTILVVANVTIIGFAINEKFGGALFIGSLIPIAIIYILYGGSKFMVPIIYSAAVLENQVGTERKALLISTFIAFVVSPEYLSQLNKIADIQNDKERMSKLRKIGFPIFSKRRFNIILILLSCLQIIAPFYLNYQFGWKYF